MTAKEFRGGLVVSDYVLIGLSEKAALGCAQAHPYSVLPIQGLFRFLRLIR
jgi:hypothetical protein